MNKAGKLILVPTPIGNLEDITLRAIKILNTADVLLAEDTRVLSKLLNHFGIKNRVVSHHKFNEHKTVQNIISRIEQGMQVALVSDAGTPGISDPGFLLVRTCVEHNIDVECLPGPTALIPALAVSGMPSDRFVFEGFLPQKKGRQKRLLQLVDEPRTVIFYESPHRLVKTLALFADFFGGERQACVCRELSKMFEEVKRGTIDELRGYYEENSPRGEIVIIIDGAPKKKTTRNHADDD